MGPEHDDRTWKRSAIPTSAKLYSSSLEPYLVSELHDILMPVCGIGSSWNETHNRRSFGAFFVRFLNPLSYFSSVWRIHKYGLTGPGLSKAIFFQGEKLLARGIARGRAWVEGKMKPPVQHPKEIHWSCPLVGLAGKMNFVHLLPCWGSRPPLRYRQSEGGTLLLLLLAHTGVSTPTSPPILMLAVTTNRQKLPAHLTATPLGVVPSKTSPSILSFPETSPFSAQGASQTEASAS